MRTVGLALLLVTKVAWAGVPDLVVGIGEESVGKDTRGSVTVGSSVETAGGYDSGPDHGYQARASASAGLRAGTDTDATASLEGAADIGYAFADRFVALSGVYANASLGNRPGLASRRDVARETFASTGIGFRLTPMWEERGDLRVTWLRFGFGGSMFWQATGTRASITGELEGYMRCRVRADRSARCLHVLDLDMVGNSGGQEIFVMNGDLVRVSGLGVKNLHVELGVRAISNQGSISVTDEGEEPTPGNTVTTEDLPVISELGPVAAITALAGPARVELRAERTGYASLEGDMTIEDRASVTTSLALGRTTLTAGGFAARTRWWTSKMDPGSADVTGGGELGLATRVSRFDLKASVGLARSFYPVLDGGVVDTPGVGMRSSVSISRAIDL